MRVNHLPVGFIEGQRHRVRVCVFRKVSSPVDTTLFGVPPALETDFRTEFLKLGSVGIWNYLECVFWSVADFK